MRSIFRQLLRKILGQRYCDFFLWLFFFRSIKKPQTNKIPVLLINHMFDQDIAALEKANDTFHFITLDAKILRNIATTFFPETVERYAIYNGVELAATRIHWRTCMDRFVQKLIKQYSIRAVLAPSDNFFYVRELIPALQNKHVPYIVIDKEGTICPAYFIHYAKYIQENCPFIADLILVWSKRQKDFWIQSGVAENTIQVTGQPRSDFWKQPGQWKMKGELGINGLRTEAKMFVFFSYDPWAYTPDYMIDKGEMHWDELRADTEDVLYSFAKRHPEVDVIVKLHPQQNDLEEIRLKIAHQGLSNILVVTGPSISNHLIVHADCIIGFQSTALIEAMVRDTPIIYTFWGEAKDRWSEALIPFHQSSGVTTARNQGELRTALETSLQSTAISETQRTARDEFVEQYFSVVDGQAAKRTLNAISNFLKKNL